MHLLISDGGQGRHHHVEAIEPRPALDVVIARRANRHYQQQERADSSEIAEGFHENSLGGDQCLVASENRLVGMFLFPATDHWSLTTFSTHDYKSA